MVSNNIELPSLLHHLMTRAWVLIRLFSHRLHPSMSEGRVIKILPTQFQHQSFYFFQQSTPKP